MAIIGEPLKKYVVNQIRKRQEMHGDGVNNSRFESNLVLLNTNNPWIKLASGVKVTKEKLQDLGIPASLQTNLSGSGLAKANVLFGGLSKYDNGKLTQASKFLGDGGAYLQSVEWGITPMPGIESIEVKSLNRGSLKKATVKLVAQTREQLAILDVLYLRLGYSVLLEWGNSFYKSTQVDDPNTKNDESLIIEQINQTLIDNEEKFFSSTYDKNVSYLTILPAIEKLREKHQGNYDALFGKISNFNWSFQPDGSYDIEITIISLGDIVESLKSNVVASSKVLQFVNNIPSPGESTTLDKARKDNIILSYLQIFKFIAISKVGNKLSIETTSNDDNSKRTAYPAKLLVAGDSIISTADKYTYTITGKFGIVDTDANEYVGEDPSYIRDNGGGGYWISNTTQEARKTPPIIFPENWTKGNLYSKFPPTAPDGIVFIGEVFNTSPKNIELQPTNLNGRKQVGYYDLTYTKDFNQTEHTLYETNKASGNTTDPNDTIRIWIQGFDDQYNKNVDINFTITLDSKVFKAKELFTVWEKKSGQGFFPLNISFKWKREPRTLTSVAINPQSLPNPLSNSDYEASDCFLLDLDIKEYYMRFGYLLNLVKQKVITRIDQSHPNYNKNPSLFNINNTSANMTCLPNQISFDWRKCIVARKDFNRASWSYDQVIFPELPQWPLGSSQVANAMNIYLNFEFIAETLTSNLDEKGNISVYNFIKSLCDGINISLGGVNNLEPIIDEDTNTLNILDSTPNTHKNTQLSQDYTLKLYGYSKQNYGNGPGDASTFVRKVDLKTAITPEYATMVTVGATAGGYVKGIEATAFSKWNDGILDRFKEVLIAADEDSKDSGNKKEDPIASFEIAMAWTARCFGIEGGILADLFP